ncbi:MAG: hypothetical protein KGN34_07665 [Sphingomonadales bacterium]|nr:hypothetical protein [Sphingomonadales bacterium]
MLLRRDLVDYLGGRSSALGLCLFFGGLAGVLFVIVLGSAYSFETRHSPPGWQVAAAAIWTIGALMLGVLLRRGTAPHWLNVLAAIWLAPVVLVWMRPLYAFAFH